MANVLIIDDDVAVCSMVSKLVRRMGHDATCRYSLSDGLKEVFSSRFDVVLLDVQMPDGSGLEVLPDIRKTEPAPEVVIMTGFGSADGAEIAIKSGAWDYIQKSDSSSKIKLLLQRVLQYRESLNRSQPHPRALNLIGIVGNGAAMKVCYDLIAQASSTDANLLLTGETGTGKELFALAVHNNSRRSGGKFVVVDCAALPESLVESVLFGHEKGAFTGAVQSRMGLVAQAHMGTLFLDEVGELPLEIQKKFLRVLQERRYLPVGGAKEVASDFRLIAATNRELDIMTRECGFRKDLLYRLRSLKINIPPLRERAEDIKALANHYVIRICERQRIGIKGLSPDFLEILTRYSWPGNVRELVNTIETAISAASDKDMLFAKHLPDYIRIQAARDSLPVAKPTGRSKPLNVADAVSLPPLKSYRKTASERAEKEYLEKLVSLTRGNIRAICDISQLSRSRFYELIKQHDILLP